MPPTPCQTCERMRKLSHLHDRVRFVLAVYHDDDKHNDEVSANAGSTAIGHYTGHGVDIESAVADLERQITEAGGL